MAKRRVRQKHDPRFGEGRWRYEALQALLEQLPPSGLRRLADRLAEGAVCLRGFYASQRTGHRQPGPLMAALPGDVVERLLDFWTNPTSTQGKMAEMLTDAWDLEGVYELGLNFDCDTWPGGDTHAAIVDCNESEMIEVIEDLLA